MFMMVWASKKHRGEGTVLLCVWHKEFHQDAWGKHSFLNKCGDSPEKDL
jgi:hypothetical protein